MPLTVRLYTQVAPARSGELSWCRAGAALQARRTATLIPSWLFIYSSLEVFLARRVRRSRFIIHGVAGEAGTVRSGLRARRLRAGLRRPPRPRRHPRDRRAG